MTAKLDGTNGVVFPDGTTQSTAAVSLGVNESWQNMTSTRSLNTTYTNSSGKPIFVSAVSNCNNAGTPTFSFYVNGNIVASSTFPTSLGSATMGGIVPNGATYQVTATGGPTLSSWWELR